MTVAGARRNGIIPAWMPRMATGNPTQCQQAPSPGTVVLNGLDGKARATGLKPAARAQQGTQSDLIAAQQEKEH
jgi:hypothetical protein